MVVADECQGYIGKTDGYSILLAARASGANILVLSATPQLHAPKMLRELRRMFQQIKTFSLEDLGIKEHMPSRLVVEKIKTPTSPLRVIRCM